MWQVIVAFTIATTPLTVPAPQSPIVGPYVSCPGGYVAPTLADCPALKDHKVDQRPPTGGGGGGGLLGLGGLGGIL